MTESKSINLFNYKFKDFVWKIKINNDYAINSRCYMDLEVKLFNFWSLCLIMS